jgi:arylsulfatase A-like enzyme
MDVLSDAGYRTHGIGKCHFMPDAQALRGFQTRERQEEGVRAIEDDEYLQYLWANGFEHLTDPHGVRSEMYYIPQVAQMPARHHPTQWIGDRAVSFVEQHAPSDQPWMLFCSFIHPHPPFSPPAPWHKLYRAPLMPLPNLPPDREALHTYINRHQNRYKYRDQGLDLNLLRTLRAYYYACCSFIDFQVGRVLAALEASGKLDDTLILYTSDHGEHLGDYGCFGKRSMHDTCLRVPLLARLPGRFDSGRVCARPASTVDVAPTTLSAAGLSGSEMRCDGVDLAELDAGTTGRDIVFSQFERGRWAIYTATNDRWKYAYSAADDMEFLFDRAQDPLETRNRAGCRFLEGELRAMRAALIDHLTAGGETPGIEDGDWKVFPRTDVPRDPDAQLLVQDMSWMDTDLPGYTDAD